MLMGTIIPIEPCSLQLSILLRLPPIDPCAALRAIGNGRFWTGASLFCICRID